eukprot:TRINITY_DN28297_c0_g1_i1.p1 TRINITY_DN28297_c0_g1~~TRINITY_DN28297_c0_g1_i1.p1  ORF type:complete len:425 (+),score=115.23 TRINITY_DN28297_c0_g1_i1:101-1276(+)
MSGHQPGPACPVCLDEITPALRFHFTDCGHLTCRLCAEAHLRVQLELQGRADRQGAPVRCPIPGCDAQAGPADWQGTGFDLEAVGAGLLSGTLTRGGCVPCTGADCPSWYFRSAGDAARFKCADCGAASCAHCRVPWHEGLSCAQHQHAREVDGLLRSGAFRICPHCGTLCERRRGCNNVRCTCGKVFLWQRRYSAGLAQAYRGAERTLEERLRIAILGVMALAAFFAAWYTHAAGLAGDPCETVLLAAWALQLLAEMDVRGAGLAPTTFLTSHGWWAPLGYVPHRLNMHLRQLILLLDEEDDRRIEKGIEREHCLLRVYACLCLFIAVYDLYCNFSAMLRAHRQQQPLARGPSVRGSAARAPARAPSVRGSTARAPSRAPSVGGAAGPAR